MICACIDTSSAVVGSSAMTQVGLGARARARARRAGACRRRTRAGSCRCALARAGMPTSCSRAMARSRACALGDVGVRADRLDDLVADAVERVEAGERVLEHHADAPAADLAHLARRAGCRCAGRRGGPRPPAMRPGGSSRPMTAAPVSDLPAPDSPTTPSTSPRRDVEATRRRPRSACRGGSGTRPRRLRTERTAAHAGSARLGRMATAASG